MGGVERWSEGELDHTRAPFAAPILHYSSSPILRDQLFCAVLPCRCPTGQMQGVYMRIGFQRLGLLALALALTSCLKQNPGSLAGVQSTNVQIYHVKGVIQELKPDGKTALIKHE